MQASFTKTFGRLLVVAAAAALTACVTATPYQPYRPESASGVHGGYSEQRLSPDRFRVRFHGNDVTSRDRVEGYLLYRAAELTVQNGYDWFRISDRHVEHDVRTYVAPDPFYRPYYGPAYGYWRPHWRYYSPSFGWSYWHPEYGGPFWADRVDIRTIESFEVEADITLGKGAPVPGDRQAFDARRVMADLGPTIELPKQR